MEHVLSNEGLAERLNVPIATVRQWRHEGTGPRAIKVGRHVRYRVTDVEAWEESHADPRTAA